jgi:HK97 gp10 family phage protein
MSEIQVSGLSELRFSLINFANELQREALQQGLGAGCDVIVADARARAPVLTGRLKLSIYSIEAKRQESSDYQVRNVTVHTGKRAAKKNQDAFYAVWVEYGHGVITTDKRSLGTPAKGFFGKKVKAVPAKPFLRPAYDTKKEAAVTAFAEYIRKMLPSLVSRARGG